MGFLKFIFIFLLVLYIGGIIGRFLLRRWILKQQKEFERTGSNFKTYTWGTGAGTGRRAQSTASTDRVEGEISVEQTARTEKKVSKQVGDYVDYEEVNEP